MAESIYYKGIEESNLKDILSSYAEERKWDQRIENCRAAFIIPNDKRHDSGYNCFDIFACVPDGTHDYSDEYTWTRKTRRKARSEPILLLLYF